MGWARRVSVAWSFVSRPLHEGWAGVCGCGAFQRPGHGRPGGIAALGARHAGDTPATRRGGTSNAAKPRWVDSPHVVSPQARVERRVDLRNKLVRMIEIVPADADDVPALGFEVALTLALAGQ